MHRHLRLLTWLLVLSSAAALTKPGRPTMRLKHQPSARHSPVPEADLPADLSGVPWAAVGALATFGGAIGPLVDSLHNQVLLQYDALPVQLGPDGTCVKSSLLIPPLLALAYVLLGAVLPRLSGQVVGGMEKCAPSLPLLRGRGATTTAGLAVLSTIAIIRLSVVLHGATLSSVAVLALLTTAIVQWAVLDGTWASLLLACVATVGGPIAEIPLMLGGGWHYLTPDYFPLANVVADSRAGLELITGPCYFAVTTDSIALFRCFRRWFLN